MLEKIKTLVGRGPVTGDDTILGLDELEGEENPELSAEDDEDFDESLIDVGLIDDEEPLELIEVEDVDLPEPPADWGTQENEDNTDMEEVEIIWEDDENAIH